VTTPWVRAGGTVNARAIPIWPKGADYTQGFVVSGDGGVLTMVEWWSRFYARRAEKHLCRLLYLRSHPGWCKLSQDDCRFRDDHLPRRPLVRGGARL
jgi:hypothetical protein